MRKETAWNLIRRNLWVYIFDIPARISLIRFTSLSHQPSVKLTYYTRPSNGRRSRADRGTGEDAHWNKGRDQRSKINTGERDYVNQWSHQVQGQQWIGYAETEAEIKKDQWSRKLIETGSIFREFKDQYSSPSRVLGRLGDLACTVSTDLNIFIIFIFEIINQNKIWNMIADLGLVVNGVAHDSKAASCE